MRVLKSWMEVYIGCGKEGWKESGRHVANREWWIRGVFEGEWKPS